MIKIKNIFKRTSAWAIAVLLFAVISSFIICALYASNTAYLRDQEEAYRTIPVEVTVQAVTGETGRASAIHSWTVDLFTGNNSVEIMDKSSENRETTQLSLAEYLKDVRVKMSKLPRLINGSSVTTQISGQYPYLVGITSILSDERLLPENGCEITWLDGYNESFFGSEELVCLVPAGKVEAYDNGNGEAVLYFYYAWGRMENGTYVEVSRQEYECTLKIVGTYTAGDEMSFYCPLPIMEQVYDGLGEAPSVDSISATLVDNQLLEEFREKASFFYSNLAENDQTSSDGIRVINRSKMYTFDNNLNALEIDDSNLIDFISALDDYNVKFKHNVKTLIVVMSSALGFLAVCLMIHCRKRGIMMGQNGRLNLKELLRFFLQQIICIVLGIAFGGIFFLWKPLDKLIIFAIINFVALAIVLLLFLVIQLVEKTKK